MKKLFGSELIFGENLTNDIIELLSADGVFAVTDENVARLYPDLFKGAKYLALPPGEHTKTLAAVESIAQFLIKHGADRKSLVVAIGGGVTGDIAGFAASIYMRGIKWINVPTTLLAQCDSAIGGKTGVDFMEIKNAIGSFHMPEKVLISAHFLRTLDRRELLCGIGEIVKTAILDEKLFLDIAKFGGGLTALGYETIWEYACKCARYKAGVTARDFTESGERKRLNAGHTIGHALETLDGFKLSHGQYVLAGLNAELTFFKTEAEERFFATLMTITTVLCGDEIKRLKGYSAEAILAVCKLDKKNAGGEVCVIAVTRPGNAEERLLDEKQMLSEIYKWKSVP